MRYYRLKLLICVLVVWTLGLVVGTTLSDAHTQGSRRDVYTLYRIDPDAPLSVTFRRDCIEHEDSAAHLWLAEYGQGVAVYGCQKGGY